MPYTVNIHFPRVEHRTQLSSDTLIHLHLQPTPSQNATNPRLFLSNNLNHHKNPETKTNLIADAKDIEQDLINMSASAATIQACYILVAMSRGTHKIKQHCLTSGCNKSVRTTFYCKSCQARARARSHKHQYSTRSKARNKENRIHAD
ncbi:hypothetical protein H9L39_00332 [Fusarium oxysporum f. sp. albedinis]|nr:hypothetical protein H9L39_00332 [Fusarium oxysporum f. sp. albedinis]